MEKIPGVKRPKVKKVWRGGSKNYSKKGGERPRTDKRLKNLVWHSVRANFFFCTETPFLYVTDHITSREIHLPEKKIMN